MLTAAFNPTPGVSTCIGLNQFVLKLEFMEQFFKVVILNSNDIFK